MEIEITAVAFCESFHGRLFRFSMNQRESSSTQNSGSRTKTLFRNQLLWERDGLAESGKRFRAKIMGSLLVRCQRVAKISEGKSKKERTL
jgi:hypothetical protein